MDFRDFRLGGSNAQAVAAFVLPKRAYSQKQLCVPISCPNDTIDRKVGYIGISDMRRNGGRTWARTKDPLIKSQLLYQLSYASIAGLRQGGEAVSPAGGALLAEHVRPAKGVFDIFLAVGTRTSDPDPL
jgi:hypothetical protein